MKNFCTDERNPLRREFVDAEKCALKSSFILRFEKGWSTLGTFLSEDKEVGPYKRKGREAK